MNDDEVIYTDSRESEMVVFFCPLCDFCDRVPVSTPARPTPPPSLEFAPLNPDSSSAHPRRRRSRRRRPTPPPSPDSPVQQKQQQVPYLVPLFVLEAESISPPSTHPWLWPKSAAAGAQLRRRRPTPPPPPRDSRRLPTLHRRLDPCPCDLQPNPRFPFSKTPAHTATQISPVVVR